MDLLKLLLTLATLVMAASSSVIMQRPESSGVRDFSALEKRAADGKVAFAYFTNWGIYGANFQPTDIVADGITHLLYSFADTRESGEIFLTDSYADEQKHYPGDSWDEAGNNLYGCLKQLYLLKLKQRNLKVLLSIGGWTYSQSGHFNFITNPASRATFVRSAVKLTEDYGFDGIDVDYEFPGSAEQGQGLAYLFQELRVGLDQLSQSKGDAPYLISTAVGAGKNSTQFLPIAAMNAPIDFWNLMAYDFAGSWLTYTDHQANLFGGDIGGVSGDRAVQFFISNGASANKITLGMPLYGRGFDNTDGVGAPYSGVGQGETEPGIWRYRLLPLSGATVYENFTDVTSWSYDTSKREFITFDTPNIVARKAEYVNERGLAGTMFWELSGDKKGAESLIARSAQTLGRLDQTPNHINFPNSKFDNVRVNFGSVSASGGSPTSSATTTTTTTASTATTSWSETPNSTSTSTVAMDTTTTATTTTTTTATATTATTTSGPPAATWTIPHIPPISPW